MKKVLLLLTLFFIPSLALAYSSADVHLPMNDGRFNDNVSFSGGFTEGIHLQPDRSDWCVSGMYLFPWVSGQSNSGFPFTGGYLLFKPNGDLIPISTTTLFGKSYYTSSGPFTWKGNDVGYCTSSAQFVTALGVVVSGDPAIAVRYAWDTPDNACRTGNLSYNQCKSAGALTNQYTYGLYDYYNIYGYNNTLHFETPNANGQVGAVIESLTGLGPVRPTHVESPNFKVGVTYTNLGQWLMKNMWLIMGSGLLLFSGLLPFVLALIGIWVLVLFLYLGFKWYHFH